MALPITYKYEVFAPSGTYLGILPKVSSQFAYTQDINTPGSQIVITTAQDIDTQQLPVSLMTDESGNQMTDEGGTNLMTNDRVQDIYGDNIVQSMVQNGNRVRVWEYTQWQPNGVLVFDGRITRWNAHIGSSDSIDLTVLNYGSEFDNSIAYGDNSIDQAVTDPDLSGNNNVFCGNSTFKCAQIFTSGPDVTNFSGCLVEGTIGVLGGNPLVPITVTVTLYRYTGGNPDSGTNLGSQTFTVTGSVDLPYPPLTALFGSAIPISPNTQYALVFTATSAANVVVFDCTTDTYLNGVAWQWTGSWAALTSGLSMVFLTFSSNTTNQYTNSVFFNADPAAMVTNLMTHYNSGGGHVTVGTITSSPAVATVSFILNTLTEAMAECLQLAPSGYYWYVDPGTNQIVFKPKSTTPDHIFTFKQVGAFELLVTTENTKNAAYLTAGNDTNGNTILAFAENNGSAGEFGVGLDRLNDSRILDGTTAQLVANNYVNTQSVEQYQSQITIFATNYDLTLLKFGQIVGFNGFNSYADTLQMQIISIARYDDYATLNLGTIPVRSSSKAERIERSLLATQTMNNPLTAL